jgi:hypothetical protein
MGGEGAMMAANRSLKANRGQLSKQNRRQGLSGSYSKVKLKPFPKATQEQIETIKTRIENENRRRNKLTVAILISLITLIILFFSYVKT